MAGAVLVTGASTGIGEAVARRLDRRGFRVFAGVRREADGARLRQGASERMSPVLIDVTEADAIAAALTFVREATGDAGLQGLVNNAGIAVAAPLEFLPPEALRRQLEINVVGAHAVTQAFLPLIRQGQGRIVNIGSISGRVAFKFLGPYCASKFALEALTTALRMELKPWQIPVAIIEPGAVATPIWSKSAQSADAITQDFPAEAMDRYGRAMEAMRRYALRAGETGIPAETVAAAVEHALIAKRPRLRYVLGRGARLGEWVRLLPERLRDRMIG